MIKNYNELISIKYKKEFDKKRLCLYCFEDGVEKSAIASHSIPKSFLNKISEKDKVSYFPQINRTNDELVNTSVGQAGVFHSLCDTHDNNIFRNIEDGAKAKNILSGEVPSQEQFYLFYLKSYLHNEYLSDLESKSPYSNILLTRGNYANSKNYTLLDILKNGKLNQDYKYTRYFLCRNYLTLICNSKYLCFSVPYGQDFQYLYIVYDLNFPEFRCLKNARNIKLPISESLAWRIEHTFFKPSYAKKYNDKIFEKISINHKEENKYFVTVENGVIKKI